ncbi:hypothetical protein IHE45_04G053200, partial [Dioscorea alata]
EETRNLVKSFKNVNARLVDAALASGPEVGSSMKMIDGFATNSTATVSCFRCSVDRPSTPGRPTKASRNTLSSTNSITSSTNI